MQKSNRIRIRNISNAINSDRGSTTFREEDYLAPRGGSTMSFSYAMAVEKALRRQYHVKVFGPLSAKPRPEREIYVEIERLPDIYHDFRYVNDLIDHNKQFSDKLKEEVPSCDQYCDEPNKTKLPKVRTRKNRSRENSINRSVSIVRSTSLTKLPPIDSSR